MAKRIVWIGAMCLALAVGARAEEEQTCYVAPNGNDTWSGTLTVPNVDGTDGPFASLERARDELRARRARAPLAGSVKMTVLLRGGTYPISQAIEFTPEDAGTREAPIVYAAYPGERPVISGGRPVRGWQQGDGALWTAQIDEVRSGAWNFHQLFVSGRRRVRARTPNQGYLYTADILAPFDRGKWYASDIVAKTGFVFHNQDIQRWRNFEDALVVIYHSWTTSIHFISELNPDEHIVKLTPPSTWPIGYWWEYNTRYHVENILEALDEPGEWYLDRGAGVLHYWPLPGEEMTSAEVIAPVVRQTLVRFKGQPAAGRFVEHLQFRGISFEYTDCLIARDMPLDQQGATERLPMMAATGLRHAVFEDCEFAHAGENGLWLDSGCSDNIIRHCHIHDLGGSAVFIGPQQFQDTPEMSVQRNTLDNNWIHDGSHIFRGSQGVWIGQSSYNEVTHNEISDFQHLGISVGHSWGYAPSTANHNLIAFNHVHHICNGYFSDGGGIYTLGISPGTVIRNNIVHDVIPTPLMPQGGTGIYHDEGSTGILAENNIVYNVGIPYHQHYGQENVARNNILAFALMSPVTCARPEEHLSYTFERNIVLSNGGQATSDHYSPMKCQTQFRQNVYWDTSCREPSFSGVTFAEWQATGRDLDSRVADPQFYDAASYDFRLQATSPALAMGFQPIDAKEVGLYGEPEWVAAPLQVRRAPLPELPALPPPPPPRAYREDFESTAVGQQPGGLSPSPADRPDLIQVAQDVAAGGTKCLRLVKVAGLTYSWQPHLFRASRPHRSGDVRLACEVLNSTGAPAEFTLSLRDYSAADGAYRDGPVILFQADGAVVAAGKTVTTVPVGVWVQVEILIHLGDPAAVATNPRTKTYRLTITVPGGSPQVFDDLACAHAEFAQVSWFGFSMGPQPGGEYSIDNLRLEGVPDGAGQ